MSGYDRDALLGRKLAMLLPHYPDDPAHFHAGAPGKAHGREGELRHKDGHGLTVLLNANFNVVADGSPATMTGFPTEIT